MCGIAGAFVYEPEAARLDLLIAAINASASRGEDAFGVVRWSPSTGFRRFSRHACGEHDWLTAIGAPELAESTIYLHTSRAEPTTEWRKEKTDVDIPPFVDEGIAVAHNGNLTNGLTVRRELVRQGAIYQSTSDLEFGLRRSSMIDTAVVPSLVARIGIWNAIGALKGGSALAILNSWKAELVLCRNFMPLAVSWEPGIVCFASEASFFPGAGRPFRSNQTWELPPFSAIQISPFGFRGPLEWGQDPGSEKNEAWEPFPALSWKNDGPRRDTLMDEKP